MFTKVRVYASLLLFGLTLATAACSSAKSTPTLDADTVRTQVANTVAADLTRTALAMPTKTATSTPVPTYTVTPTLAVTPTTAGTAVSTLAPTSPRPSSADKASLISQDPADGTVLAPGQQFTLTWTLKNIGTTTWNTNYQLRYYLADATLRFGAADIKFPNEVKPNESVDLSLSMKAPSGAGDYTTIWVLTNDTGVNFYPVNLTIKVSGAVTATTTVTQAPTATPTETPTP